jgi:hypothetical protein
MTRKNACYSSEIGSRYSSVWYSVLAGCSFRFLSKGHFHRVRALLALGDGRAGEAQRAFWQGLQNGGKDSEDFFALEKLVTEA